MGENLKKVASYYFGTINGKHSISDQTLLGVFDTKMDPMKDIDPNKENKERR